MRALVHKQAIRHAGEQLVLNQDIGVLSFEPSGHRDTACAFSARCVELGISRFIPGLFLSQLCFEAASDADKKTSKKRHCDDNTGDE
jgi:hypothetical protein